MLPAGDTGTRIYASPLTAVAERTIYSSSHQNLRLECRARCSMEATLYLSRDPCKRRDVHGIKMSTTNDTTSVGILPTTTQGQFTVTVNVAHLPVGVQYNLCMDIDGVTVVEAFGDTGFLIYVAVVTSSGGTIKQAVAQSLPMKCASGCAISSQAFLAITCDLTILDSSSGTADGVYRKAPTSFQGVAPTWVASIDASGLCIGQHRVLCTELDGAGTRKPVGQSHCSQPQNIGLSHSGWRFAEGS